MCRGALSWVEELSGRDLDFGPFRSNPLCFRSFLESLMTGRAGYTLFLFDVRVLAVWLTDGLGSRLKVLGFNDGLQKTKHIGGSCKLGFM